MPAMVRFAASRKIKGRPAASGGVPKTALLIGDSLTEHNYGACPFYWQNALLGSAGFKVIHNAGHSGQSISGLITQMAEDWVDLAGGAMGLVGMPDVGWAFLRIGTNNARGSAGSAGVAIDAGMQADYVTIINTLLTYAQHVVILPVPPIGGSGITKNTAVPGYNTYLQGLVTADTTGRLHWLNDCSDLVDGSGNIIPEYFNPGDELHFYPAGQYRMALTAEPLLEALLTSVGASYTSDLVTDAADVYPATAQWVDNPTNAGTGGSLGSGLTGSGPDDMTFACSSGAAGVIAKVAADVGDPNQTPWVRFTPSVTKASGFFAVDIAASGRTVTASDPLDLDQQCEIKFENVDPARISEVQLEMRSGIYELPKRARLQFGGYTGGTISRTVTLRQQIHRKDSNADNGTKVAKFNIITSADYTGSVGAISFRNYSIRG